MGCTQRQVSWRCETAVHALVRAAGALWDLHKRCQEAKAFRHNCLELDTHSRNILRVFDAEGAPYLLVLAQSVAHSCQKTGCPESHTVSHVFSCKG